jgi:probable HAF family extracellular repeat protein
MSATNLRRPPYHAKRYALAFSTGLAGLLLVSAASAAEIFSFSHFDPGGSVFGISANGLVVVGSNGHAFTYDGSMHDLGTLGGPISYGTAISANGAVIVGTSDLSTPGDRHVISYYDGVMHDLNFPGVAQGVSADGTVIVGTWNTPTHQEAFSYSNGVLTGLGLLPGGHTSRAYGVSGDGTVVVGSADNGTTFHGFRYSGGAMVDLGALGDPATAASRASQATAVSADGAVIVGSSLSQKGAPHSTPVMWTGTTIVDLGSLGGNGFANAVSGDGSVIVGSSETVLFSGQRHAFRWRADTGTKSIVDLLTASGVDMTGWDLIEAAGVSADGTVIAGHGTDPSNNLEGWIVRCTNWCGILTADNAAKSFSGLGTLGATGTTYIASLFDEAGDMAEAGKANPITGFALGAFDSDPTTSATVGATYSLGNDLVTGATVGVASIQTLMPFNGSASFNGPSATVFVASKPDTGPNWLVGGSLVGLSGTITRGYFNANTPVSSTGTTTGNGAGLTAQAGWTFKDLVANALVTPFVSLTVSSMNYAAYTETGGSFPASFPASFSAFSTTSAIVRVGVDGRYQFSKDSYLSANIAYGHDFGSGGTIAGTIPGILALSVPGAAPASDFIEAGLGLDMPLKDNIRLTAHLGAVIPFTGGPSLQARVGASMAF